jgi:beta-N-acetylhexosaminidase
MGAGAALCLAASAAVLPPATERAAAGPAAGVALTDRQLAGQRVIYSYSGLVPPPALFDIIRRGEAAGVIFFGENIDRTDTAHDQIRAVVQQLQQANEESPVKAPLLMMTDQEGGFVHRLPGEPVMSAKKVGEAPPPIDEQLARSTGRGAGETLKSAGMNMNLAPVLDVYREAGNFIDRFERSYSMDPTAVAELATDFLVQQQAIGPAATVKHFPGLGAAPAGQDTDSQPVTLDLTEEELRTIDELPYESAIRAGVELVMMSWAVYPVYDTLPAGLSHKIVNDELRGRLGFGGVTITDALEAGALTPLGSISENAVRAAGAGMDLLMFAGKDPTTGAGGVDALVSALGSGTLDRAAFEASANRVIALRQRIGARLGPGTGPDGPTDPPPSPPGAAPVPPAAPAPAVSGAPRFTG